MLKHLERQLRAVERAANAADLDDFLTSVSEAVASHNTVAENCEKLAQLPASGLPKILRQHADAAVGRATTDQARSTGLPRLGSKTARRGLRAQAVVHEMKCVSTLAVPCRKSC